MDNSSWIETTRRGENCTLRRKRPRPCRRCHRRLHQGKTHVQKTIFHLYESQNLIKNLLTIHYRKKISSFVHLFSFNCNGIAFDMDFAFLLTKIKLSSPHVLKRSSVFLFIFQIVSPAATRIQTCVLWQQRVLNSVRRDRLRTPLRPARGIVVGKFLGS